MSGLVHLPVDKAVDNVKTVLMVICFHKPDETEKFFDSLQKSDLDKIPKIVLINTAKESGIQEEPNKTIIQKYRKDKDRVFVFHRNLYSTPIRWATYNLINGHYDFVISTECDIWFEKKFEFAHCIQYVQKHKEIGLINILTRYSTETNNCRFFDPTSGGSPGDPPRFKYRQVGEFIEITSRNALWHMCLTRPQDLVGCFEHVKKEITDGTFTSYCRSVLKKRVLTLDCREYAVHFDHIDTSKKYPETVPLYSRQYYRVKWRDIQAEDIEEV